MQRRINSLFACYICGHKQVALEPGTHQNSRTVRCQDRRTDFCQVTYVLRKPPFKDWLIHKGVAVQYAELLEVLCSTKVTTLQYSVVKVL